MTIEIERITEETANHYGIKGNLFKVSFENFAPSCKTLVTRRGNLGSKVFAVKDLATLHLLIIELEPSTVRFTHESKTKRYASIVSRTSLYLVEANLAASKYIKDYAGAVAYLMGCVKMHSRD